MSEKRILYVCPTILSLMNSIVTQVTVNKDAPADLVLEDITDFSAILDKLKAHKVFENIYSFAYRETRNHEKTLDDAVRNGWKRYPCRHFPIPPFTHTYTDLCINLDSPAPVIIYYALVERHMRPTVHFVSEGTATYAMDFVNISKNETNHAHYGKAAFMNNIGNMYSYRPELYTGGSPLLTHVQLPDYSRLSPEIHEMISDIFGSTPEIKEKVIFFEGTFWGDGRLTDEMKLFLEIAQLVGKDNIIVKRHPRNRIDRFTPLGFHVMQQQATPWEVMIKDIDFSQKLLISVASFTCFSAIEMYGKVSRSLLLGDLMRGQVDFLASPGYQIFFEQARTNMNREEIVSWRPSTLQELKLDVAAIGELIGGWNQ